MWQWRVRRARGLNWCRWRQYFGCVGRRRDDSSSLNSGDCRGGTSSDIDACSLLTAAQASTIVGVQYASATPRSVANIGVCTYKLATQTGVNVFDLEVTVYLPASGLTFEMMDSSLRATGTVTSVSGVGDRAEVGPIELLAQAAHYLISVDGAGELRSPTSKSAAVAKAVIAALP